MPATGGDSTGGASTGGDGTGGTISVTPDGRCDFIATCAGTPGTCTIVLNGYPCGHCQTVGFSCYSGNFQGYYFSDGTTYRCDSSGCLKAATSMANHCKSAACN
jgi:hypothetical protein